MADIPQTSNEKRCVRCGVVFETSIVPCPEGKLGCLVLHYGECCPKCGGVIYGRSS